MESVVNTVGPVEAEERRTKFCGQPIRNVHNGGEAKREDCTPNHNSSNHWVQEHKIDERADGVKHVVRTKVLEP